MKAGRASQTAQVVAFFRGLAAAEVSPLVVDSFAESVVDAPYRAALRLARSWPAGTAAVMRGLAKLTGDASRHFELRTRAIDDVVSQAVERGTRQVILLGAGLDARAYRLSSIASCTVYSVDHPDTQQVAQERFAPFTPLARQLVWVPVVFGRDSLADALRHARFVSDEPAVVVWEGVTMYLPKPAAQATVHALSALLASGSTLALTYRDAREVLVGPLAGVMAGVVGESFKAAYLPRDIAALLESHSFALRSDEGHAEWTARWLQAQHRPSMERLFVGQRN
jgi:methyltransferase (TIGR00027 family)